MIVVYLLALAFFPQLFRSYGHCFTLHFLSDGSSLIHYHNFPFIAVFLCRLALAFSSQLFFPSWFPSLSLPEPALIPQIFALMESLQQPSQSSPDPPSPSANRASSSSSFFFPVNIRTVLSSFSSSSSSSGSTASPPYPDRCLRYVSGLTEVLLLVGASRRFLDAAVAFLESSSLLDHAVLLTVTAGRLAIQFRAATNTTPASSMTTDNNNSSISSTAKQPLVPSSPLSPRRAAQLSQVTGTLSVRSFPSFFLFFSRFLFLSRSLSFSPSLSSSINCCCHFFQLHVLTLVDWAAVGRRLCALSLIRFALLDPTTDALLCLKAVGAVRVYASSFLSTFFLLSVPSVPLDDDDDDDDDDEEEEEEDQEKAINLFSLSFFSLLFSHILFRVLSRFICCGLQVAALSGKMSMFRSFSPCFRGPLRSSIA